MSNKKPLTVESIALFTACGVSQQDMSLLSNSTAKAALDVPEGTARTHFVNQRLEKARKNADYRKPGLSPIMDDGKPTGWYVYRQDGFKASFKGIVGLNALRAQIGSVQIPE